METSHNFSLSGRSALVTGASRGIGRAIALGLAEAGADVVVHCAGDAERAAEVCDRIKAAGRRSAVVRADLTEDQSVAVLWEGAVTALGGIDILVCNASIQEPAALTGITREQFDRQIAVNLRSTLELCQRCVPAMRERGWGRILTVGSVQERRPHEEMIVYAATKAAQSSIMLNLARQLAPDGITVNGLAPGVILTDRNINRLKDEAYARNVSASIRAGRFGEAADCVGAALLLCSPAGRYITGQNLFVDGGLSIP